MKRFWLWLDKLERTDKWWASIVVAGLCVGFTVVVILLMTFLAMLNSSTGAL